MQAAHSLVRPFRGPSRVWYGFGAAARAAECAAEFGIAPGSALVYTDPAVDRLGV